MPPNNQFSTNPNPAQNFSVPPELPQEKTGGSFSKIWISLIVLLTLVLIAGLAYIFLKKPISTPESNIQPQTETPFGEEPTVSSATTSASPAQGTSSCQENNWNCLIAAAATCTPNTLKLSSMGMINQYEIVGTQNNSCHFKISYLGGTVKFDQTVINKAISGGAKQSDIDSFTKFLQMGVDYNKGKVGNCQSSNAELVDFLQSTMQSQKLLEETGSASLNSTPDYLTTKCTGLN